MQHDPSGRVMPPVQLPTTQVEPQPIDPQLRRTGLAQWAALLAGLIGGLLVIGAVYLIVADRSPQGPASPGQSSVDIADDDASTAPDADSPESTPSETLPADPETTEPGAGSPGTTGPGSTGPVDPTPSTPPTSELPGAPTSPPVLGEPLPNPSELPGLPGAAVPPFPPAIGSTGLMPTLPAEAAIRYW